LILVTTGAILFNQDNNMAEKNINDIPRDVRTLFTKAVEAAQRENLDYAITLFNQALEKEPGFYDCRKALRAAQFQKCGGGGGFFKKMWSGAGSSPQVAKAKMAMSKNPGEAMAIAEQILNNDPNNSAAHRIIVDAATALELPRTAVLSYETLSNNSPKDRDLAIAFARALAAAGDVGEGEHNRGEQILMDLLRETPNDGELNQALKDLSARKTLDQGGYARARRRPGFLPRHSKEQNGGRFAGTGKARRQDRGRHRTADRRIRDATTNRTQQSQAHPLAGGTLHAEKTVRSRARALRPHQEFRDGQRPVARKRHGQHHRAPVRTSIGTARPRSAPDYAAQAEKFKARET
jgi:tetratricopeptide (TPR) repeat protein